MNTIPDMLALWIQNPLALLWHKIVYATIWLTSWIVPIDAFLIKLLPIVYQDLHSMLSAIT